MIIGTIPNTVVQKRTDIMDEFCENRNGMDRVPAREVRFLENCPYQAHADIASKI